MKLFIRSISCAIGSLCMICAAVSIMTAYIAFAMSDIVFLPLGVYSFISAFTGGFLIWGEQYHIK